MHEGRWPGRSEETVDDQKDEVCALTVDNLHGHINLPFIG